MKSYPPTDGHVSPSNTFVEFPRELVEQSIVDCFEQQAIKNKSRLALKTTDRALTYDDLNRQANRVAHAILNACPAGAEPIALLYKPSAALIIASIAVLKSGNAFVPLDLSLPLEGLGAILQDIGSRLILCDSATFSIASKIPYRAAALLNIDSINTRVAESNPRIKIPPGALAYIHYTSGSTGLPKGVMANHRSEIHNIMTNTNALHIAAEDRISLVRANNVGATRDILLALLNGAALLPLDLKEGLLDLGHWLADEEITVFTCVTSVFRHAVKNVTGRSALPKVRLIHVGGEAITKADVDLFKIHFSDECLFVSRLGLSETETLSYYFITKQTQFNDERIPVGYPLEGNEIFLLDDNGKKVGVNQVGEIVVRSEYLAMGYWRQPQLTHAKFVPDPKDENVRLYYTGDLGKRLLDGCLVHMGRKDFQVKIRGHRVEIPAVEMALMELSSVNQAVVVCRQDLRGANHLIAYVVPSASHSFEVREARRQLQSTLAHYMMPTRYVILDSLPLTASGKVDRGALPSPDFSRAELDSSSVIARTSLEKALLTLWAQALGFDSIGIHDDVSDLGGDSLIATQLGTRIMDSFSPKLPVNIYQTPTVAKLAEFLETHENHPGEAAVVADILLKIDSMPDEEIENMVEERRGSRERA